MRRLRGKSSELSENVHIRRLGRALIARLQNANWLQGGCDKAVRMLLGKSSVRRASQVEFEPNVVDPRSVASRPPVINNDDPLLGECRRPPFRRFPSARKNPRTARGNVLGPLSVPARPPAKKQRPAEGECRRPPFRRFRPPVKKRRPVKGSAVHPLSDNVHIR